MSRYRIVTDRYSGYEVQIWRWWFPFWVQPYVNTSSSLERAVALAWLHRQGLGRGTGKVVKYVSFCDLEAQ